MVGTDLAGNIGLRLHSEGPSEALSWNLGLTYGVGGVRAGLEASQTF